jgi:hypothetical protein
MMDYGRGSDVELRRVLILTKAISRPLLAAEIALDLIHRMQDGYVPFDSLYLHLEPLFADTTNWPLAWLSGPLSRISSSKLV